MDALFFDRLASSNATLRDHVRRGVHGGASGSGIGTDSHSAGVATSFAVLDAFLPWRGWPAGAMTEIMTDVPGCGELSLLLPAMAYLTRQKRPILCVGAPHELFAPALLQADVDPALVTQINVGDSSKKHQKKNLWATEQALKTGLPGMVMLWSTAHSTLAPEVLRRLHLAVLGSASSNAPADSTTSKTMLIHFRGASSMSQPSPAWLRFGYAADDAHIRLQVLKCRGRELTRPLITLDRAAVQARLYGQMRAARLLDSTVEFGTTSLSQIVEANRYTTETLAAITSRATAEMRTQSKGSDFVDHQLTSVPATQPSTLRPITRATH